MIEIETEMHIPSRLTSRKLNASISRTKRICRIFESPLRIKLISKNSETKELDYALSPLTNRGCVSGVTTPHQLWVSSYLLDAFFTCAPREILRTSLL